VCSHADAEVRARAEHHEHLVTRADHAVDGQRIVRIRKWDAEK